MNYKNIKYAIILLIIVTSSIYSQWDTIKFRCGSENQPNLNNDLPHKTPDYGQHLRIMIVYVRFNGDLTEGSYEPYRCIWPDHSAAKPTNPYTFDGTFIEGTEQNPNIYPFMNRYREYTITDYFCEMSRGDLDVIGEEYYVTTQHPAEYYQNTLQWNYGYINHEVLQTLEASQQNPDFSRYNNWTFNTIAQGWEWNPASGDNTVDMIVMCYRHIPGGNYWFFGGPHSGIDRLSFPSDLYFDGTHITTLSGVTCVTNLDNYSKTTQIWEHEICHRWMEHHSLGIMMGTDDNTIGMSPWERNDMEYITPTPINYPYSSNYSEHTLGDFYSTGDAIALQLPNLMEYFWITNHQKVSKYDGISQGSKECWEINHARQDPYCDAGKGLYILHENPERSSCNFDKELDIEQSDGKYDWTVDRWVPYFVQGYNFCIPMFKPTLHGSNRLNGKEEFTQVIATLSNSQCNWPEPRDWTQEVSDNPCSENDNDYFVTIDKKGDGKDAFNIGYDEIFSPYSNPSTNMCTGGNTGLTIRLLENNNGVMNVRIYYDNSYALQQCPPSKPKNIQTSQYVLNPDNGSFYPKITWDLNTEPDFINGGHYVLWKAVSTTCDPEIEPSYIYFTSLQPNVNEYIDIQNIMYNIGGGSGVCQNVYRSVSYKIQAVDNTELASLLSDRAIINGYTNPCDPQWHKPKVSENESNLPSGYTVSNYPNPFNPVTQIKFTIPIASHVSIKIYDLTGKLVSTLLNSELHQAGYYSVDFDGSSLASGVYFYTIEVRQAGSLTVNFKDSKKMVLIK